MNRTGVRYITEDFIKISAHDDHLERIKKLNLDCGKDDKQIRYIEHFDSLVNLNVLSLRFHAIEKIEKLDKLVNLRELYLCENKITKLDGLENILRLKIIDVRGNQISTIPHWLTRRCKYLTKINFSNNLFDSIEEVTKLWNLKDLIDLDMSGNPVTSIAHYRPYVIMRLKYLQYLDKNEVLGDERQAAVEEFEENELDKLNNRLMEREKQIEQMKENQTNLEKDRAQKEQFQKDLHKKNKSNIEQIKKLEENLKTKDLLLKKKSEDLFRACQKYYELEQDIAFIKIDAKFDLLSNNIGSLEEPDNLSDHSISSTGDQAYMGKGQFITKKEKELFLERKRAKQNHLQNGKIENCDKNVGLQIKEELIDSLNNRVKEKLDELKTINQEISDKHQMVSKLNSELRQKEDMIEPKLLGKSATFGQYGSDRPKSALALTNHLSSHRNLLPQSRRSDTNLFHQQNGMSPSYADQFLEKVENLSELQKEAEELRRQMELTERESNNQQKDITYLKNQLELLKTADPNMARHLEDEVKEKESYVDENMKLYETLSKRLDQLSEAIEESISDIRDLELKLIEDNQYFTEEMRQKINSALAQLSQSLPNKNNENYKKILNHYRAAESENDKLRNQINKQQKEIDLLQSNLQNETSNSQRSGRLIDTEVEILRQELNRLRQDALSAKDDLESEIEMEKVLNDELQKQVDELKQNEENLNEELQEMQDRHRIMLDKLKNDQFLIKDSFEKEMTNFQDDLIHRIKMCGTESYLANLESSKHPIDKAIFQLVQSLKPLEKETDRTNFRGSSINKINDDLHQIKEELLEISKKIPMDAGTNPHQSPFDYEDNITTNDRRSASTPIRKMLSKSQDEYNNDMTYIKSKLKRMFDLLNRTGPRSKRKRKPFTKPVKSYNSRFEMMTNETSNDNSSEEPHRTPKSRSYSQDRLPRKSNYAPQSTKKWNSLQQGISSDEQALYDAIQDELRDLVRHIDSAEKRNAQRIEQAMHHIADMENQLRDKDEKLAATYRSEHLNREKDKLTQYLRDTMSQVDQCQEDLRILNDKITNKMPLGYLELGRNDYVSELERLRAILQNQKVEIERLNALLERICAPVYPFFTPFAQVPQPITVNSSQPGIPLFAPYSFLPNSIQNSHSTPMLNNGFYSQYYNPTMKNMGSLFCNVPEHHFLEDYFQVNGMPYKSSMKMRRKFKSDSERFMDTLETLQDDISRKNEELDNVEIQISKQTHEIGRLNYQIDQLNLTKQDLLNTITSLRYETDHITKEQIASTGESLDFLRAKKIQLTQEIDQMNSTYCHKKDEISQAEKELKDCKKYLSQIQNETGETLRRYDESRLNHRKIILECEELEKRSKDTSVELAKALNNLNLVQNEITNLSSNKMSLEDILSKIQFIIKEKDQEFRKMKEEINKSTQHLNSLHSNLNVTTEQSRGTMNMLSENDQLLSSTRLELNRLKNEIVLNQEQLQKIESELGERTASLNIANGEVERSRQVHQRIMSEHQNEQASLLRQLSDLKFDLEAVKDEKSDLMSTTESIRMKNLHLKETVEKQEQAILHQQSDLDKLNWQKQHIDNMMKMKQTQLDKIMAEYQNKVLELEKMSEEIHQQQIEFKNMDSDIKKRATEFDRIRQMIATESENKQRLEFDKNNLESNISTLTKEKFLIENERKELESNLKLLRRQESQTRESLSNFESKVSQARTELEKMCSEKCTETIKRDELKIQSNSIAKQLHESKCELQSIKERIVMIEAQCDERTAEIRKKMQLQASLNNEIRRLQDQIRMANMTFDEINNQEQQKKENIYGLDTDISRKNDEIKCLEMKINNLQNHVFKEDNKLEKVFKNNNSTSETGRIKSQISDKEILQSAAARVHQVKKDAALKEFTEQKIFELEEIIRTHESNAEQYEQENRKLSNHLTALTRDLAILKQNHHQELESKEKEIAKHKKRIAKEISQLEKLAEEQCLRANNLTDELNQSRRDYMLLRNRIVIFGRFLDKETTCLAQNHFIEQQNLFKEYMVANGSKSQSSWEELNSKFEKKDIPESLETAIFEELRRHLHNQLHLLNENIASAIQASQNGITQSKSLDYNLKHKTGSSGIGSTLDHTGNSSDTFLEHDRFKKKLHTQFNEEVEKINSENVQCEMLCRKLRNDVDDLKFSFPSEKLVSE